MRPDRTQDRLNVSFEKSLLERGSSGMRMHSIKKTPCVALIETLLPAYGPCVGFDSACRNMRWEPKNGHVPRGFCGALGHPSEVELVLVIAEPGDPHQRESYPAELSREELFEQVCCYVYSCFESGKDQFHRNVRYILDSCWPDSSFHEQMHRAWITEATLCSALAECGTVATATSRLCSKSYLSMQLELLPNAIVVALGAKARDRMLHLGIDFTAAWAAAPPGCNQPAAKQSWDSVAAQVLSRR